MENKKFKSLVSILKWAILGGVLYLVLSALITNLEQISWSEIHPAYGLIALAMAVEVLARACLGSGFKMAAALFSVPLSSPRSLAIAWLSQLGKYLPGKVALILGSFYLLKKQTRTHTAGWISVLVNFSIPFAALLLSLPLFLDERMPRPEPTILPWFIPGMIILALLLYFLLPGFVKRLGDVPRISNMKYLVGLLFYACLQCILVGLSAWLVSRAIAPIGMEWLPWMVVYTSGAGLMGIVAVFSPAGIGVRDGLLFWMTSQIMGGPTAALMVTLLRVIQTLADLICALTGYLLFKFSTPNKTDP
ncbi:MAG: hypothetical protein MI747_08890 [Desulfobacterales bacterium]|nr:hypothetical protein [Desulfobacterales bacterium]